MCKPTFTVPDKVRLETPYGTVQLLFQSLKECVVLLPDQYTEPPTPYCTLDGVAIEGNLTFELWGRIWECQRDDECTRCYDVATDCRISREQRDKLAQKLSQILRQWVATNPDTMKAIDRALKRQAIERLEAGVSSLDNQINVLMRQKAEQQATLHKLQQQLDEETTT